MWEDPVERWPQGVTRTPRVNHSTALPESLRTRRSSWGWVPGCRNGVGMAVTVPLRNKKIETLMLLVRNRNAFFHSTFDSQDAAAGFFNPLVPSPSATVRESLPGNELSWSSADTSRSRGGCVCRSIKGEGNQINGDLQ